jgi:hypothetical protein
MPKIRKSKLRSLNKLVNLIPDNARHYRYKLPFKLSIRAGLFLCSHNSGFEQSYLVVFFFVIGGNYINTAS